MKRNNRVASNNVEEPFGSYVLAPKIQAMVRKREKGDATRTSPLRTRSSRRPNYKGEHASLPISPSQPVLCINLV